MEELRSLPYDCGDVAFCGVVLTTRHIDGEISGTWPRSLLAWGECQSPTLSIVCAGGSIKFPVPIGERPSGTRVLFRVSCFL